jgi:hypothetical protein
MTCIAFQGTDWTVVGVIAFVLLLSVIAGMREG